VAGSLRQREAEHRHEVWEGDVGTFVSLCPRRGSGDWARRGVPR